MIEMINLWCCVTDDECETDDDCPEGFVCENNECKEAPGKAPIVLLHLWG